MNTSMHNMQVATAPSCSRLDRVQDLGSSVRTNPIFGAAIGGFWAVEAHTTKPYHSLRERTT